jgi:hypothetical protein
MSRLVAASALTAGLLSVVATLMTVSFEMLN